MSNTRRIGEIGERIALALLKDKGYQILQHNWRCQWGEIDIIAQSGETIVFVEVKAAHSKSFGAPEEWVNVRKRKHIAKAAMQFLLDNSITDAPVRFDVIAIDLNTRTPKHIENAFSLNDAGTLED